MNVNQDFWFGKHSEGFLKHHFLPIDVSIVTIVNYYGQIKSTNWQKYIERGNSNPGYPVPFAQVNKVDKS